MKVVLCGTVLAFASLAAGQGLQPQATVPAFIENDAYSCPAWMEELSRRLQASRRPGFNQEIVELIAIVCEPQPAAYAKADKRICIFNGHRCPENMDVWLPCKWPLGCHCPDGSQVIPFNTTNIKCETQPVLATAQAERWEHVNGQWCPEHGEEVCGLVAQEQADASMRAYLNGIKHWPPKSFGNHIRNLRFDWPPKLVCFTEGSGLCVVRVETSPLPTTPKLVCFGFSGKQCDASFPISDDPRKNCEIMQAAMSEFPGDRSVRVEASPRQIWVSCAPWANDPLGPDENWVRKWNHIPSH